MYQRTTFEAVGDRVAEVIVREAKKWKADLIVMGTHGRRRFNRSRAMTKLCSSRRRRS